MYEGEKSLSGKSVHKKYILQFLQKMFDINLSFRSYPEKSRR